MKLISLKIQGFKNLDIELDFTQSEGISVLVGNNGSGKSNILEAISAIFYGLYDETGKNRPDFSYEIRYSISGHIIKAQQTYSIGGWSMGLTGSEVMESMGPETEGRMHSFIVDDSSMKGDKTEYLPQNIIALYSGEESRLYDEYYLLGYRDFIKKIVTKKSNIYDESPMRFIDKRFWNIALITMAVFDIPLEIIIGELRIQTIHLDLNIRNLKKFHTSNPNVVTRLVTTMGEIDHLDLEAIKSLQLTQEELYRILSVAYIPNDEQHKLIDKITLIFDTGITGDHLSEGQKKQILIYFVTQILADKDSIVLLDEPDSYIHVGNKERIKKFMTDFLDITHEGEFIMTTHSPTLMHLLDKKHIFYLESGKVKGKEKREILNDITAGQMNMVDMEIFLGSDKKYLLVTEGITDKKHLEIAIEKLGIENQFDIYSADGCDKLKQFLMGIPRDFFGEKQVIGIFDADNEGIKQLKGVGEEIEMSKLYRSRVSRKVHGIALPFSDMQFGEYKNFCIEFYYSRAILDSHNMLVKKDFQEVNSVCDNPVGKFSIREFNTETHLCFYDTNSASNVKNSFAESARRFDVKEFEGFRILFDLILTL